MPWEPEPVNRRSPGATGLRLAGAGVLQNLVIEAVTKLRVGLEPFHQARCLVSGNQSSGSSSAMAIRAARSPPTVFRLAPVSTRERCDWLTPTIPASRLVLSPRSLISVGS